MTPEQPVQRFLAWLPFLLVLVATAHLVTWYGKLPAEVPLHFNFRGEADGYGTRQMLWVLPIIALVLLSVLAFVTGHPEWGNFPVRVTDDNRAQLYGLYGGLMLFLQNATSLVLSAVLWMSVDVARGALTRLAPWFTVSILLVLLGGTFSFLLLMVRAR